MAGSCHLLSFRTCTRLGSDLLLSLAHMLLLLALLIKYEMLAQLFFQGYISFISSTVWAFRRLSNYPDVDCMLISQFTEDDHSIFSSSSWVS